MLQIRAELATAEASLSTVAAERSQIQQELNAKSDKLMLMESELRLKTSRLEAAQQQLATEAEEHEAERALLQKQLEQLKVCTRVQSSLRQALVTATQQCCQQCAWQVDELLIVVLQTYGLMGACGFDQLLRCRCCLAG